MRSLLPLHRHDWERHPPPRLQPGRCPPPAAYSTTDTAPGTNTDSDGHQGQKRIPPSSDTSYSRDNRTTIPGPPRPRRRQTSGTDYSREHRAEAADRHRYPKRQLRNHILTILGRGPVLSILSLLTIVGLLSSCPTATAYHFALRNAYGMVEPCYQLTAYDCSNPTRVQAYSSIPARQCSVRTTPIQRDRPTKFQLLQKERKRYITAYSCFLSRTDIRYNCGIYGHPELDPIHWSFSVPQRVTAEQCMTWLCTQSYRPAAHSTLMHGRDFERPIFLDEPTNVTYMVHGRTYTKEPSLPTDQVSETACQGEWIEYEEGHPLNHMVAHYDEVHL